MAASRKKKNAAVSSPPASEPGPPTMPPAPPQMTAFRVPIEAKGNAPTYYVNHAEINITPFEMALTFARLPPRFDKEEHERFAKGESVTIPAMVQILIPMNLVQFLIDAMGSMKANYDSSIVPVVALEKPKSNE